MIIIFTNITKLGIVFVTALNMKTRWISYFLLISFYICQAQQKDSLEWNTHVHFESDSIINKEAAHTEYSKDSISVDLKPIRIFGISKANSEVDTKHYNWLKNRVYKLYPYLTIAVEQYRNISDSMAINHKDAKFKHYVKQRQKELSDEYESKLKNLTKTEGKIFSKLMYRTTGKTVYDIIKELRSGWSAFWWNAKAKAFDIDLKEPYDPANIRDDAYVETILQKAYQNGELKPLKDSDY